MTFTDLLTALGLLLVLEGLVLAAHPAGIRRVLLLVQGLPDGVLRWGGVAAASVGVLVLWLVRG